MLGKGKAYYALGAYPMLFAAGGYVLEKYFTGKLAWLSYLFMANVFVVGIFIMPLSLPVLPIEKMVGYCKLASNFIGNWPTRWEDGKNHLLPQDYADETGWQQLSAIVVSAYQSLDSAGQKNCMIYANDYGEAGAIQYYGKQKGLPDPVSMSDAFLFWAPDSTDKTTLIFIGRNPGKLDSLYNNYRLFGTVNNPYFRENGLNVYVCQNPKPYWQTYYRANVKELKDELNIQ